MKKLVSGALALSMLCSSLAGLGINAAAEVNAVFKHQNVVGSQTCYSGDDITEKTITEIPDVYQGMRINQPVFRAEGFEANKSYTVKQELKDGTVIKEETVTASGDGVLEFKHVRNCEMIEILDGSEAVASLGTDLKYVNGVAVTYAPMSYQIYQRDANNEAVITIKGKVSDAASVSVYIDGTSENVTIENNEFTYTKTLGTGLHDITVTSDKGEVAKYEKVGVGDVWVAAGQSNMTDMGALADNFAPDTDDAINENMHIIYAEDCKWQQMSHPAGEGRFFKTGTRTSPVTSFAREIAASENVPVGIVQSSVGGTYTYQWVSGIKDSDGNSGYLMDALESCFDKMPSHDVKGILWYQGCNDTDSDGLAFNYKANQEKVFDAMRAFFGENVPIITTQLNGANQDSDLDRWSYVKDIQRQNEDLYDNVYVVGTGELELGDTIHNSAASNVKLGKKWANAAENVVYGKTTVNFRQPTIDTAKVTGDKQITLTFKNTDGLKLATGEKRIGITNSLTKIALGDLTKEFVVRKGASKQATSSNSGKGTEMAIKSAVIGEDGKTVVITTEEDLAGVIAVDCMYGKKFTPTLVDASTNESVLSFYNVIAEYENKIAVTETVEKTAAETAYCNQYTSSEASDAKMYVNGYSGNNGVALMKFDLTDVDLSTIASAKLAVYATSIETRGRSGDVTVSQISTTGWDSTSTYGNPNYSDIVGEEITKINGGTASIFPVNNYSSIDITEYLRSCSGEIGIGLSSNYASDATLSGINSENPPKLIIQPGRQIDLTYTCDGSPCAGMEVTIEAVGATEYQTTKHTTDETGKLTIYLAEGSYKAATEKVIGEYNATENTFEVTTDDVIKSYTVEKNTEEKPTPPDNPTYTFGTAFNQIKEFNTSSLSETKIGDTGLKVSTSSSNYNNVAIMDASTKTGTGYYPYGSGLPENGYYLFLGSGGNGNVSATLTFDNPIAAGKCVKITYAKPSATNNGSSNRTANNAHTITVGSETVDIIGMGCENDKWYTTTVKATEEISKLDFTLGKWAALAISKIEVTESADTMELTAENDVTEKYITPDNQTVQYKATVYNSITTLMGENEIIAKGTAVDAAAVTYSVNGYNGVSIDENGLLTITSAAAPGTVTVTAKSGDSEKSIELLLKTLGNADEVAIYGDEIIKTGAEAVTAQYKAIPISDGTVIPARSTKWEIVGEAHGASIAEDGTLTVPTNATEGVIAIRATLTVGGSQTEEVSSEISVTIRTASSKECPYEITGVFLKNGETDITNAEGIEGLIINKTAEASVEYIAVIKVFNADDRVIANTVVSLNNLTDGVQSVSADLDFKDGAKVKAYVAEAAEEADGGSEMTADYEIKVYGSDSAITSIEVDKRDEGAQTADVIIAQYKGTRLNKAEIKRAALTQGKNEIQDSAFSLEADSFKVFLWDSAEGMKPLAAPVSEFSEKERTVGTGAAASDEVFETASGEYKNVPLVSDWITGTKSGLGMGSGIISPQGAPYGVDPDLVDVSTLNVSYTYDDNYPSPTTDNALWYKTGAYAAGGSSGNNSIYARDGADWEQKALPIGNGYMGGMVFGLPDKDQIQINEETFWAAGYRGTQTAVNSNTVNSKMSEGINGYMSVGNIFVDFDMPAGAAVNNYYRDLNLDEATAHVQYEYDGKQFKREYFASYPKEVMAFRYTGDELNFDVKPVSMHPGEVTVNNGEITIIGKLKDSEPYSSGGNAAWNQESDLEYCTKIKVIADDGTITDGYNTVNVSGATGVTILVTAATDYDPDQFELNADGSVNMNKTPYKSTQGVQAAIDKATARMNGAAAMTYADLKTEHIADYKSQFDKVKFTLTADNEICQTPTDELQASYNSVVGTTAADGKTAVSYDASKYAALDKHLEELHYNYARYMMISSSRSTTMPATLQGKWCQSTAEIWGSCYCININMEMNYWFAGGANLTDSGMSLVKWFNSQIPAGRVTAKNMYKVTPKSYKFEDGQMTFTDSADDADDVFIMHTKQAIMGTTDMTGSTNIQSPGNTAWLMYNIWDLYQTTGDKELLENELYPIMRKAANFYTQYLYTNMKKTTTDTATYPDGYYYTTWDGRSPEQGPTHTGIKYDLQLVAGMYDYTIAAAETLGVDADKVNAWKEIRNHLETPVELGDDGQIKEWAEETTYNTDANGNALGDPVHRHISHLVGLYPGNLINCDTPDLLNGAKVVLEKRGDDSTGWSCSNKFLLWARTLEGDKALELFRYQLAKKTYSNLFDTHSPFQIDGNFGSAAGVMELLMQSQTGTVYILPALPEVWDKGEISGIKAKNGAEVSIKWSDGKATEIKIVPASDGDITIGYEKGNALILNGAEVTFTDGKYTITDARKGETYTFTAK